jgi:O-antigen ligase
MSALIIGLYKYNVFDPVLERQKNLNQSGEIMNGRDDRFATTVQIFTRSPLYGVGGGNIFPVKEIRDSTFISLFQAAPHNYWLLTLGEQGIIGFFLLLCIFGVIIRRLDYKKYSSYAVIFTILILFNTEAIFIDDEFIPLLFLLIIISITTPVKRTPLRQ